MRTRLAWSLFAVALLVAGGLMAFVSARLFELETERREATRAALAQESVRLALWRMDSELTPLVTEEAARPYFHYLSFYPAERPYPRMLEPLRPEETLLPSPLLTAGSSRVVVHFQIGPDGALTSPQVPEDLEGAAGEYLSARRAEAARAGLEDLRERLTAAQLAERLPRVRHGVHAPVAAETVYDNVAWQSRNANQHEYIQRSELTTRQAVQRKLDQQVELPGETHVELREGPMTALWVDGRLLLARGIDVGGRGYVQGCLLDWTGIQAELVESIGDLAPNVTLRPATDLDRVEPADVHRLATLPVEVIPGDMAVNVPGEGSPLRATVYVAWACLALVAGGLAFVMRRTLTLAQRRADFASAVSHELRTPLTTFRMYTEMLRGGMVNEEATRREYLDTLHAEALRLGHLVENVLAWARLSNSSASGRIEELPVAELLDRATERLRTHTTQAGMELVVEPPGNAPVRADAAVVEQILFNLVDNACKYASGAEDRRIHLSAHARPRGVEIRVRDHGRGVGRDESAHVFKPFRKSAQAAADSARGVGLGLALSRRLARAMGGELELDAEVRDGACFVLSLPGAKK